MIRRYILLVVVLVFSYKNNAQPVQQIEIKALNYLNQINKWDASTIYENSDDSLEHYNKSLLDYLHMVLVKNPATLKYDFLKLKSTRLTVLTSDDKLFRIYSWNVGRDGGTDSYDNIIQYQSGKVSKVKILNDVSEMVEGSVCSGLFYSNLYTIKTKKNKKVYLFLGNGKYAMGLYGFDIQAFSIDNEKLNDSIKFFKTPKGSINSIDYFIEAIFSSGKVCRINLSADRQKIYIPVVTEGGAVTSKHLIYVFNGNNYVFDKNAM